MRKLSFVLIAVLAATLCRAAETDSLFVIQGSKGRLATHLQLPSIGNNEKIPIVIICHGLTGNQNEPFITNIALEVLKEGMGTVRFDFNGHGKSDGDFQDMDAKNIQEDLRKVIDWTLAQPFTASVSLVGHSLGGIVIGMVAPDFGEHKIKSLVLLASGGVAPDLMLMGNFFGIRFDPWNLPEYITLPNGLKMGKSYLQTMRDLPIYQTARNYTGPALVLNGTHDSVVPYNYAIRYAEVMPKAELKLLDGDNHGFTKDMNSTALLIAQWLKSKNK